MKKANKLDAGWDLEATHGGFVRHDEVLKVRTGVKGGIPQGMVGLVSPRSGLAAKHGVFVVNAPGIVDAGFEGEICVLLSKVGSEPYAVKAGDRIAQMVVLNLANYEPGTQSDRGERGFGSSGA